MADRDSSSTPPLPPLGAIPPPAAPNQVELKFKGNNNDEVTFKMKYAMKLKKAMEAYSARVQQPVDQLRFLFDGERLKEDDTPEQHDMANGDIVDVHMEQIGGGTAGDLKKSDISVDWICLDDGEITKLKRALAQVKIENALVRDASEHFKAENESQKKKIETLTADNEQLSKENFWHATFIPDNIALKADFQSQKQTIETLTANNMALAKENTAFKASLNGPTFKTTELKLKQELERTLADVKKLSEKNRSLKTAILAKECALEDLSAAVVAKERALGTLNKENDDLKIAVYTKGCALEPLTKEINDLSAGIVTREGALEVLTQTVHDLEVAMVTKDRRIEALIKKNDGANKLVKDLRAALAFTNKENDDLHSTVVAKECALECALETGFEKQRALKDTIFEKDRAIESVLDEIDRSDCFLAKLDLSNS